jgi:putative permease
MKNSEKRVALLQKLGILALILISMKYLNELFATQLRTLFDAINAIVFPLGVALFISYLLAPVVKFVDKRVKKRWISVIIVFTIMLIIILIFIILIGNMIYDQAIIFISRDWDNIVAYIQNFTENNERLSDMYASISAYINLDTVSPVIINVVNVFKSVASVLISIVLIPVFLFFILNDKEKIFEGFLVVVPKKHQKHIRELGIRSNQVIEKYFNGRFTSMLIMSIFFTIVFFILGFRERSIFFGFTLGFLDIVPYVGGFIGMLIPLLYSLTVPGDLLFGEWTWLVIVGVNLVGQGLQGGIIQPWIMGREVSLHPLLVLSSFIFFGALFGVTGIILAIPITGIIKVTFEYLYEIKQQPLPKPKVVK